MKIVLSTETDPASETLFSQESQNTQSWAKSKNPVIIIPTRNLEGDRSGMIGSVE
jgi:hypothetical protein